MSSSERLDKPQGVYTKHIWKVYRDSNPVIPVFHADHRAVLIGQIHDRAAFSPLDDRPPRRLARSDPYGLNVRVSAPSRVRIQVTQRC